MTRQIVKLIALAAAALAALALLGTASAQDQGWRYSGSVYILTTPEGADLPAAASEKDFPLLVRLNKAYFDFRQAKLAGEDVRFFTSAGTPLAHQIEEWDAANGTASIWVRIPEIKGNARQEIKMRWGKADAAGESSGAAVFNESNGYLSVWHMNEPVKDEVGTPASTDVGTTAAAGMIGKARHFAGKQGVFGGDKIPNYPAGASPHTTEAWFRAEKPNATIIGWGNEQAQGKVVMHFRSPPHISMDCYFSAANVAGESRVPMSEWAHVVHTCRAGDSRVYVNGVLDGVSNRTGSPLNIRSPARLWIGGWYNNYDFVGDIDEVRVSKVARSADWVKLEYENQKPMQTLVGLVVQPGNEFSVSQSQLTVVEGKSATVTAQAGGAQKVYWVLKRDGREAVVAVDRFTCTFDAGRVVGDQAAVLQFKAVYAGEVKVRDVPVTIKEDIPEPIVALKAPAVWNGRDAIEVVPEISNLAAMQARGAGELKYVWTVSGGAVIKEVAPDKLILKRSQCSGRITVNLALNNGGADAVATTSMMVTEPKSDPWVQRTPGKDEKPEDNQFYARDDKNEGTLYYNGTLDHAAESVFLNVYADDKPFKTESRKLAADKAYAFTVKLRPGLIKYKVEFGAKTGGAETVLRTVTNLVCGDAYLIDGQSNALATDTRDEAPPDTSDWIRSFGSPKGDQKGERLNLWCNPVWKARKGEKAELGWWGMELAKRLVESQKVPIFIVNAAVGGTRIDQHQRNEANPTDLTTIYGRMLWRVQQARLTHGIRAVLWHQGENDQGAAGPTGGYGWESYQQYFMDMSAAWKQDFPNVRHYYIFQIWPNSCSMGNGHGDMLREVQRTLPRLYSNMDIMSTLGIRPPGPAHFPLAGWAEFARLVQPLIERDFYGKAATALLTPPNLRQACYTSSARDAIALEFDQPVVWTDSLAGQIYLDGEKEKVASGAASGNVVTLKLKETSAAQKVTYLKEMAWSQDKLIVGANGIAALTFCDVPILPARGLMGAAARADLPPIRGLDEVGYEQVELRGGFWGPRLKTQHEVTIPHALDCLEKDGHVTNFDKAAGLIKGPPSGHAAFDSDLHKALEGAMYSLQHNSDDALRRRAEGILDHILAAQQKDGFLISYFIIQDSDKRWEDMRIMHQLYNAGHFFEMAVEHYRLTGQPRVLDAAKRFADHIDGVFGPGKRYDVPGHQEVELALVKLYRATGERRYLELSRFFLDERGYAHGTERKPFDPKTAVQAPIPEGLSAEERQRETRRARNRVRNGRMQDHKPVVEQLDAVGHAVRAGYMYSAMTDIVRFMDAPGYERALDSLWTDVVGRKMYVTGAIGTAQYGDEGFGDPYLLPNNSAYCETCAAVAHVLWQHRMNLLKGQARYADVMELALYNGMLSGISISGDRFFYQNPLVSKGGGQRSSWIGLSCCPTNMARIIPQVGGLVYARGKGQVFVNLYAAGQASIKMDGGATVKLTQQTDYPWDGRVRLTVAPEQPSEFALCLRIPGWAQGRPVPSDLYRFADSKAPPVGLKVNGQAADASPQDDGYVHLQRRWQAGDVVELDLPMPARRVCAHEKVQADQGKVAIMRGPIVYCLEAVDQPGVDVLRVTLPRDAVLSAEHRAELLGGVTVLRAGAFAGGERPVTLTAVPYYAWANREKSPMTVWVDEAPARASSPAQ